MLPALDRLLRAFVAAGTEGRLTTAAISGIDPVTLVASHYIVLNRLGDEALRRALDLKNNRIYFPGETRWSDATEWDCIWDAGVPETDLATLDGVLVTLLTPQRLGFDEALMTVYRRTGWPAGQPGGWEKFRRDIFALSGVDRDKKTLRRHLVELSKGWDKPVPTLSHMS